ncbi:MAG: DUF5906 domain-containing protein [Bacteroidota bacterium]
MSYYTNYNDVMEQIRDYGLMVETLLVDTPRVQRCTTSDNQRERRGWYWLSSITIESEPYIIGAFGIYAGNDNGKQKITINKQKSEQLTAEQREAIKAQQRESQKKAEAERKRQADQAAAKAKSAWLRCTTTGSSEYLTRKQVQSHGLRFSPTGSLVVPMLDDHDTIRGLQFILPRGHERIAKTGRDKEFWPKGLSSAGTYYLIGDHPKDILLIAEGYATGASLHEATGHPVAVVWSANNIMNAAQVLHKKHKRARILICADDDWLQKCTACGQYTSVAGTNCNHCQQPHRQKNAGAVSAEAAAVTINGSWIAPTFTDPRPTDKKGPTDFNDLHCLEGLAVVTRQIEAKIDALGWIKPLALADATQEGGGGKRTALKSMLTNDEALERFSLVYGGKGTMFDHQEHVLVPKADVLDILPEHGWRDMRAHKKVARLDEVGFDPSGTDKRITCNLYGGWPTEALPGECAQLLALLRYLCSNEQNPDEVYGWVLRWLALPIQNPGAKMRTSLIFHGPQGTGKNLFFESIMAIYAEYGRIVDQSAIEDKFNDWASKKLFLIADEVVARTELFHVKNKLKSLVTGEWIRINPKNVAAHDERNHVNIVFLSNESIPLVLEHDDRRYVVIHTPEKLPPEFYCSIRDEIAAGGIEALHHYLLGVSLADYDIHSKPPATRAKQQLIEASLDSVGSFVRDWFQGEIPKAPFCPCSSAQLYLAYRKYCDRTGERYPRIQRQFVGDLRMIPGWKVGPVNTKDPLSGERTTRKMVIQPDDLLGQVDRYRPENQSNEYWLHECYRTFAITGEYPE